MKYFKVVPKRNAPRYEITKDTFETVTENKPPFEQKNQNGGFSRYGICPSCLNSIQLIGLYKSSESPKYGRHTGKDVDGLPKWNYDKYKYCPYATNKPSSPNNDEQVEIDDSVIELYNLLKSQFDRVIYVISDELKMRFTANFCKKALQQFLADKAYCYPWLTEVNLPYIFAYRGMQQQDIWGQKILLGSDLYDALKSHNNVKFEEASGEYKLLNKRCGYLKLQLRFTKHKQIAVEGDALRETMMLYIDDMLSNKVVFEKKIEFDETIFTNLILKKSNDNKRQQWLLDISDSLMTQLEKKTGAAL